MVKTIASIKIKYKKPIKKITPTETKTTNDNLIDKCIKALEQYGFEKEEIKSVVEQTINDLKTTNIVEIIKSCLITIGVNNGECD
jgi:Holliday junction resolvasome RuvABC DNA-binding subunit